MCNSCGSPTYGQDQPAERKKDAERLKRVLERRGRKAEAPNN